MPAAHLPRGPRIDRETYIRSQVECADRHLPPAIRAVRRQIAAVRDARLRAAPPLDVLSLPVRDRADRRELLARIAAYQAAQDRQDAIRATLLRAARVARRMGLHVRSSRDRAGRVSSYYARADGPGPVVRISDHEIPDTDRRAFMAAVHGRFECGGYPGPEILIDRPRSATWLRRALILALAERL